MWETPDELADLQALLDRSFAESSEHLRSIMTEPRRLRAERLVAELPSPAVLNIAAVINGSSERHGGRRDRAAASGTIDWS